MMVSEQELWHTNNHVVTYGQSHALLNSTIWALFTHHHILMWFVFVSYCSVYLFGHYVAGLACVSKVTTWLATCFGPDKKLQPAYSTQEPSYNLLSPDISQVVTCFTQREPNYNCLPFSQPNKSLQSASSEQEPSCGSWTPGRYL